MTFWEKITEEFGSEKFMAALVDSLGYGFWVLGGLVLLGGIFVLLGGASATKPLNKEHH